MSSTGILFNIETKIIKDKSKLDVLKEYKQMNSCSTEDALLDLGFVLEEQLLDDLKYNLGLEVVDLDKISINQKAIDLVSSELIFENSILPFDEDGDIIKVATYKYIDSSIIEKIKQVSGRRVKLYLSRRSDIKINIEKHYKSKKILYLADKVEESISKLNTNLYTQQLKINNSPAINLIDDILHMAVNINASDIHIEPMINSLKIRFRIDGELIEMYSLSKNITQCVIGRIKVLANMDISEKRLPQDGRIVVNMDSKLIDFRVSSIPTIHGEKIVIRVLKKNNINLSRLELGFNKAEEDIIRRLIIQNSGLILICGPTGSGKTTTLYSILNDLNGKNKNIITIEDPVEYMIDGINQININPKIGLDFSSCLKAVLRQDPDIIMVGEIRDLDTARIALRAAITGHLVLSTIHTNDVASAILRLVDMGVETYLISCAVKGIISQRLVRKICPYCRVAYYATEYEKKILELDDKEDILLSRGVGCKECNGSGYMGRIGVFEVIEIDKEIRNMIIKNHNIDILRDLCINKGMKTLKNSCREMVISKITTIDEMVKIISNID
ncbi:MULTISPECIES: GspE/PulE family protein [Caloramator]|uniref:Type IV pilus assembly protein PilB n=1 Tax=Caloramator proteoclasticus DSM 10124 TaxID=1121262 RepID=A0A1M4YAB9_9CLOT|nr:MULTISPECIES: GspE/PulE family protein [Caloramator]SHF02660.1 type IV pilus assembly protein PilB [Caloramator proteoclasticus DSM 10124]